MSIDIQY